MPHINIYMDEAASLLIARTAKRQGKSLSRWAREQLLAAAGAPEWPRGYRDLIGSIDDSSFVAPLDDSEGGDQPANFA